MDEIADDITIKAFEELIAKSYELKYEKEKLEAEIKEINNQRHRLDSQIMEYMEEFEKDSYKCKHGTVVKMRRLSVKVPKDPQDKEAFFNYLESKGIKDTLLTVNSQTLNKFYRGELETALEEGRDTVEIPGIGAPSYHETLTLRK